VDGHSLLSSHTAATPAVHRPPPLILHLAPCCDADFIVSELQGVRLVLAEQHSAKEAARPIVATLPGELQLLAKRLSIPVSEEAVKGAPERVLTQIQAKVRMQRKEGMEEDV